MALGKCPECAGSVSTTAEACPHCGNTKFWVATGNRLEVQCSFCKGRGTWHVGDGFGTRPCDECNTTGRVSVDQEKDLRDGSLRDGYQLPKRYRL